MLCAWNILQDEEDIYIYDDATLLSKAPSGGCEELYKDFAIFSKSLPGGEVAEENELYCDPTSIVDVDTWEVIISGL